MWKDGKSKVVQGNEQNTLATVKGLLISKERGCKVGKIICSQMINKKLKRGSIFLSAFVKPCTNAWHHNNITYSLMIIS